MSAIQLESGMILFKTLICSRASDECSIESQDDFEELASHTQGFKG